MSDYLTSIATELRKRPTDTEQILWKHIRAKQISGYKFRRQVPIGNYIVDFICHDKKLIIEVDGGQHAEDRTKDVERDAWLGKEGFKVLRFWNNEVLMSIEAVLEVIRKELLSSPPP